MNFNEQEKTKKVENQVRQGNELQKMRRKNKREE